jgi:ribosomal protein S12 methylthiotransferase accessory factor
VSKISGVVRNLERRPALDGSGVFVFAAGYNPVMLPGCDDLLRSTFRTRCAGKGTSEAQARASALGEAIERYCGQFQGNEPRRRASFRSLGALARDPNHWMGYSRRQYEMRHEWNRRRSRFTFVPVPLPDDAEIEWTPVYSLTRREHGYLPTSCCYLSYVQPAAEHHGVGCSNGNAAGSTLEEAILQGFFEVVERDAVAIWWYNQVRRPAVDLDAFAHPVLRRVVAFLRERGRDLWVLDVTSDLGIPVFAAISRSTRGPEAITLGFGAHLDPEVALLRAVTEQAQTLAALLPDGGAPGVRLDFIDDPATLDWLTTATLAAQGYLVPETDTRPRGPRDFEERASGDLREDILHCQALVERLGMELLVLDQTRPEIGLPVVKVFVPGMRHFWARFAPGRLYDVPVQLGWLHEPRKEVDLNPVAMFL